MRLHDITPAIPDWVDLAARWFKASWDDTYCLVWNPAAGRLNFCHTETPGIIEGQVHQTYVTGGTYGGGYQPDLDNYAADGKDTSLRVQIHIV